MIGFQFHETMSGSFTRDGEERPIRFTVRAVAPSLVQHLRDRTATLEGHVDADGLATHAVLAGSLLIDPVLGRKIRYEFSFTGDDGRSYRFRGQKDVTLRDLVGSMTTLPAEIVDETGAAKVVNEVDYRVGRKLARNDGRWRLSK
jgi:hypothetical protein